MLNWSIQTWARQGGGTRGLLPGGAGSSDGHLLQRSGGGAEEHVVEDRPCQLRRGGQRRGVQKPTDGDKRRARLIGRVGIDRKGLVKLGVCTRERGCVRVRARLRGTHMPYACASTRVASAPSHV